MGNQDAATDEVAVMLLCLEGRAHRVGVALGWLCWRVAARPERVCVVNARARARAPTELERGTCDDPIVLDPPGKFQCIVEAAIF